MGAGPVGARPAHRAAGGVSSLAGAHVRTAAAFAPLAGRLTHGDRAEQGQVATSFTRVHVGTMANDHCWVWRKGERACV